MNEHVEIQICTCQFHPHKDGSGGDFKKDELFCVVFIESTIIFIGDELAKNLVDYTEAETMNPSIVRNVSEFASNISTIQDYRQAEVRAI